MTIVLAVIAGILLLACAEALLEHWVKWTAAAKRRAKEDE